MCSHRERRLRAAPYTAFYRALFAPLENLLGPVDLDTMFPIVGFGAGGPLSLATIGRYPRDRFVTYVSCELTCWDEQLPNASGRYELLMSCDDESWCHSILTAVGRTTFEEVIDDLHTMDIGAWVGADCPIQGLLFQRMYSTCVDEKPFNVLRLYGLTRLQLEWGLRHGSCSLIEQLRAERHFPHVTLGNE